MRRTLWHQPHVSSSFLSKLLIGKKTFGWPEAWDLRHDLRSPIFKNPRYTDRRYLCPYCTLPLRVSKSFAIGSSCFFQVSNCWLNSYGKIWRRYAPPYFFANCEKHGGGGKPPSRPCAGLGGTVPLNKIISDIHTRRSAKGSCSVSLLGLSYVAFNSKSHFDN